MRRLAVITLVAACGRVGFDPPAGTSSYVPDPAFGTTGVVVTGSAQADESPHAAIRMGSRVFAVGYTRPAPGGDTAVAFELIAFGEAGVDLAVGDGGRVRANHAGSISDFGYGATARSATQFYVVGDGIETESDDDMQLARFDASGALDPTFGTGGFAHQHVRLEDTAHAVAVDASDRIYLCGTSSYATEPDVVIARLLADGSLDPAFGVAGVAAFHDTATAQTCEAAALAPDGSLWIAGSEDDRVLIARAHADGTLDSSFGGAGAITFASGYAWALAAIDDDVIVAGVEDQLPSIGRFDPTGTQVWAGPISAEHGNIEAVVVDDRGRIVIGGWLGDGAPDRSFVARLLPTGEPDVTFGGVAGTIVVDVPGADRVQGLVIDERQRIWAIGDVDGHSAFAFRLKATE